jgi:hypothetical protein
MRTREIEKAALRLSAKERAALSYKLIESIDSETIKDSDELWQKEVEARYQQITSGSAKLKNAELVIREAKSKYK